MQTPNSQFIKFSESVGARLSSLRNLSDPRTSRALFTTLSSVASKGLSMLALLVTMPIMLDSLGTTGFGLWMTLISVTTMMAASDLGLGNGLFSELSLAMGRSDTDRARVIFKSGMGMLLVLALLVVVIIALLHPILPWGLLFGIDDLESISQVKNISWVMMFVISLGIVGGGVNKAYLSCQSGYLFYILTSFGALLSMGCVLVFHWLNLGYVALVMAASLLPMAGYVPALFLFFRKYPWADMRWERGVTDEAMRLLRCGLQYFFLSLISIASLYCDNLIVGHYAGYEAVTSIAVPSRLIVIMQAVTAMFCLPMWSAFAEAEAKRDFRWIRRTIAWGTAITTLVNAAFGIFLVLLGRWLFGLWLGDAYAFDASIVALLCLNSLLFSLTSPLFMYMNSIQWVRGQILMYTAFALVSIAAKVTVLQRFGIDAFLLSHAICYTLLVVAPLLLISHYKIKSRSNTDGNAR